MIYFNNDYAEGAHPKLLERLAETNLVQTGGYGLDEYCDRARAAIKTACGLEQAEVHFMTGGTQANLTVIDALLKPYQGVLCADSGHINVHETGAVEACGHKVLALPGRSGKLTADQIQEALELHLKDEAREHTAAPGMVYISYPTEYGTLYTKEELTEIWRMCRTYELPLFIDGARLGYGLAASGAMLTLKDIATLCDVFYIGGTKVGALFGEAVVVTRPELLKDFRYMIKQKGGMLAKGRLLGIQFLELFTDDLYFKIAKNGVEMAMLLKEGFKNKGYQFYMESPTNQQFVIMEDKKLSALSKKYGFCYQQKYDENSSVVRFCTSWATKREQVEQLLRDI